MAEIPKIYLETTMFNFPFADDSPQYQADTLRLFEEIRAGKFQPFTSFYVMQELEDATDSLREDRIQLIKRYNVEVIPANDEIARLANLYINEGVLSKKNVTDALHIATTTFAGLDFIVSLNFRHIVKRKTKIGTDSINTREGFGRIFIYTPVEVIENVEEF